MTKPLDFSSPYVRPAGLAKALVGCLLPLALGGTVAHAASAEAAASFHAKVEPLLKKYCYDCHGDGMEKGKVAFDGFENDAALIGQHDLWLKALKNVRAGVMPPFEEGMPRPTADEIKTLADWIKFQAFAIDPAKPDPGRVTVRRLNRIEYRNTIKDLMGYDFNAEAEFPPDDSGNGFDNNGDVLTISPLHMEKYLAAAEVIVDKSVPKVSRVVRERVATGREFRPEGGGGGRSATDLLSSKRPSKVSRKFTVDEAETYRFVAELQIRGSFDFDPSHCKVICRIDGVERFTEDIVWHENKTLLHEYEVKWEAGEHTVEFEVEVLPPIAGVANTERPDAPDTPPVAAAAAPAAGAAAPAQPANGAPVIPEAGAVAAAATPAAGAPAAGAAPAVPASLLRPSVAAATAARLDVRIVNVKVIGPLQEKHWVPPENYARFFPDGAAPAEPAARDRYAGEVLRRFAARAFRRPVDDAKVAQLVTLAKSIYTMPGKTFEEGIGRAMMGVLASPNFLFRVEQPVSTAAAREKVAPIDEYALASRLSYFLWSTMPDDALFQAAEKGELRKNLTAQLDRMLKDPRSKAFVRDFTGQWLQARDVEFVPINARAVLGSVPGQRRGGPRIDFDGPLRKLMRSETEMYFEHVLREDRNVTELIYSDYTFLNERLATHYGVPDVTGADLRLVKLPADSPRGGILTQGTILAVTSNPTRTSPVKRGLFILDNVLGTPPPPAPPDVPDLEEARKEFKGREPKLSEMLALHRSNALCSSCHQRMDPLGLALENFNAMGNWRDTEAGQPIEPAGRLITGEAFADVRELKRILANERKMDFYRCITEKMLTYALGRGLEHYDVETVDTIVERLVQNEGKMSALIAGIVESAPFQKQRMPTAVAAVSLNQE